MAYEVLNFVDGRRSYADIYRAVSAEADAAGVVVLRRGDSRRRYGVSGFGGEGGDCHGQPRDDAARRHEGAMGTKDVIE